MSRPDTRDRRDPRKLGEAVLGLRTKGSRAKLSTLYDKNHPAMLSVPPYTGEGEGIAQEQAAAYAAEFPGGVPVVSDDPGGA
jgi:hypothetical protein